MFKDLSEQEEIMMINQYGANWREKNKIEKQLDKAIEILGSSTSDICPQEYGLVEKGSDCPKHNNCKKCWREALNKI